MNNLLPLPIPSENWLHEINASFRKKGIPPNERPYRAIEKWALLHGQTFEPIWHLGGDACTVIYNYFSEETSFGRDQSVPINRTCFPCDGSFWEIAVPVVYGSRLVDPLSSVRAMHRKLLAAFQKDKKAFSAFNAHWFDCLEHFSRNDFVERDARCSPLTRKFLQATMRSLASAVADLLSYPINLQAAGDSRHAFECALKAVGVEKTGLTEPEAEQVLRHRLGKTLGRCQTILSQSNYNRLYRALNFYPPDDDRYTHTSLSLERVWNCYAEARHAAAVAMRVLS
jgi:hypothetical protein